MDRYWSETQINLDALGEAVLGCCASTHRLAVWAKVTAIPMHLFWGLAWRPSKDKEHSPRSDAKKENGNSQALFRPRLRPAHCPHTHIPFDKARHAAKPESRGMRPKQWRTWVKCKTRAIDATHFKSLIRASGMSSKISCAHRHAKYYLWQTRPFCRPLLQTTQITPTNTQMCVCVYGKHKNSLLELTLSSIGGYSIFIDEGRKNEWWIVVRFECYLSSLSPTLETQLWII